MLKDENLDFGVDAEMWRGLHPKAKEVFNKKSEYINELLVRLHESEQREIDTANALITKEREIEELKTQLKHAKAKKVNYKKSCENWENLYLRTRVELLEMKLDGGDK